MSQDADECVVEGSADRCIFDGTFGKFKPLIAPCEKIQHSPLPLFEKEQHGVANACTNF